MTLLTDDVAVLNIAHLDAMTEGDMGFRKDLVAMFHDILAESDGRLQDASLDFSAWSKEAHKLKGSAFNLGANRLGNVCKAMEMCAVPEEREALVEQYRQEVVALQAALAGLA